MKKSKVKTLYFHWNTQGISSSKQFTYRVPCLCLCLEYMCCDCVITIQGNFTQQITEEMHTLESLLAVPCIATLTCERPHTPKGNQQRHFNPLSSPEQSFAESEYTQDSPEALPESLLLSPLSPLLCTLFISREALKVISAITLNSQME